MRLKPLAVLLISLFLMAGTAPASADEGMFPMSGIQKLDLRSKGLEIDPAEIFAKDDSLVFAVVSLGATGSFVSPEGLMITNHHVAFGAVQQASSKENDYIRNGFLAGTRADEIQAKGMTARITEAFTDVSEEVLGAVKPKMDAAARARAVEKRMKEIVARAEKKNPGKRAEVSEMFAGKSYILFLYTYLKDIRLVYAPPRSIGEFGGEEDNWMWPRHTGDFSFLRAYVAPDGSPADYSPRNVPFRPKRHLKVEPKGVAENDFVFLLGYPGRTSRHTTASFMFYEEEVRMPFVVEWNGWQIELLQKMGAGDRGIALKLAGRIKGLANTMKNYSGKLQGMARAAIVENKLREEKALQDFIDSDPERRSLYGTVIEDIGKIHADMRGGAGNGMLLEQLRRSVGMMNLAATVYESSLERRKPDLEREPSYMNRNFAPTKQRLLLSLRNFHAPADKAVFSELLRRIAELPAAGRIQAVDEALKGDYGEGAVSAFLDKAYGRSRLTDPGFIGDCLEKTPAEISRLADPFIDLAIKLYPAWQELKEKQKVRKGALDALYAKLGDVKGLYLGKDFIPDANGTLRLTFGRIKGYRKADAVEYRPFTSLRGVMEKTTGREPFDTPAAVAALHAAGDFGAFEHPALRDVPVCILYDADTTGGNSGSPVLNARGDLIGVNFDRTYEATINDYAWSRDYSRSIGVDIRYVLWVTRKFAGADSLLKEMGIPAD